MNELMYVANNNYNKFLYKETMQYWIFILISFGLIYFSIDKILIKEEDFIETVVALDIPIIIHVVTLMILLYFLKKYHNYQLKKFRPSMIYFAGWEVLMTGGIVTFFLYDNQLKETYRSIIRPFVISGFYILF